MRQKKELGLRLVFWVPVWTLSLVTLSILAGCTSTQTADDNTTNTFVTVVSVRAVSGDFMDEPESDFLLSDVCFADDDHPPCTVFNDNAIVTFQARAKDLTTFTSANNDILFDRYRVTYTRSDGRNVPGVDVPFAFDGVSSFRVPADGGEVSRAFIVVRHQAKIESPLREISQALAGIMSVLAEIEFYGRDGAGRSIQVTAHLNITFGDFANE